MVLIHYKKTDFNQFLFETTVNIPVDELIKQLVESNEKNNLLNSIAIIFTKIQKLTI